MNHTRGLVEVLDGLGDLGDDMATEILREIGQTDDLVEQLPTGAEFEDDVIILARLGEVDEFNDVGMVDLSHDLHFLEDIGALWMELAQIPVVASETCRNER